MTADSHLIILSNGVKVPKLAYGTGTKWFRRDGTSDLEKPDASVNQELVDSILTALRAGFTHIDAAEVYGTETEIGLAVAQYLKETGKPRSSLFITNKVSAPPKDIKASIAAQLKRLGPAVEGYVDLYLVHSPFWDYESPETTLTLEKVWGDLESLVTETKQARAIGVSNWRIQDFKAIQALNPKIQPTVNQIEFHAYNQNPTLRKHLAGEKSGVVTAAYGPLQPLVQFVESGPVKAVVDKIAANKGPDVSGSQVLLAWGWAVGTIQVTTSSKEERLKEAVAALDIVLTAEEVEEITKAGEGIRLRKFFGDKKFSFDD
ncbi:UNVERIFIED_CONTAM: hypothetical protein HDU68_011601 [Siphonaria sp. JEL0065]|nr:hypothetical protein HDU68_011601 [Siphonaria sp. JEL0065]